MDSIKQYFQEAQIPLTEDQLQKLSTLLHVFKAKNAELNLSAIRDDNDIVIKHFVDSLLAVDVIDFSEVQTLLDIGAGGGFPGVPLALYFPNLQVTLNDSVAKKMNAVQSLIDGTEVTNATTEIGRCEDLACSSQFRGQFDVVTARAVALLPIVMEYAAPLLRVGGKFIAYKGSTYQEELQQSENAMKQLHMELSSVSIKQLPQDMGERALLVFEKTAPTSDEFPREVGMAKRKPL